MFLRIRRLRPLEFIEPCLPTAADCPPTGAEWVHEIKHDGYRLMVRREEDRVRLFTRHGRDWSGRYPRVVEAALRLNAQSFLIDGEAVYCRGDGIADFGKLHSRAHDDEVILYGFDLLQLNGDDLRPRFLPERKGKLQRLLAPSHGIRFSEHIDNDGPIVFEHICKMSLEGIISKRRDMPYQSGRSRSWAKVLNPKCAAVTR